MYEICYPLLMHTTVLLVFSWRPFPDAGKVFQKVRQYKAYLSADSVIWKPIQLFRWPASVLLSVLRGRESIRFFEIPGKVAFIAGTHSTPDLFDTQEGRIHQFFCFPHP